MSSREYHTPTYASNFLYSPDGRATQVVYGNGLWRTNSYDSRLQLGGFIDDYKNGGTAATQLENVTFNWGTPTNNGNTINNGNLLGAIWEYGGVGATGFTSFNQTFTYDSLNRLKTASDTGGWSRNYYYDAYGNMAESGSGVPFDVNAPVTGSQSVAGFYNTNNQMVVAGMGFDQAGNLNQLSGYNTLAYDGENRLTSAGRVGGISMTYQYDGEGRRVVKSGGGNQTIYVYDASGSLAAEYATTALQALCVTCYLSSDHLGTTRLITDQNGNAVSRHDYLPFGEEITAGTAGRNGGLWDAADLVNQKFTAKERDSESGLDYFGARYYGSALGRFTSPDWSAVPVGVPYASLSNPQTLNLYSYVSNNPLRRRDADGHHQECAPDTWNEKTSTLTAGACHEVPDWWQFQPARRWIGEHPKTVKTVFVAVNVLTVASAVIDAGGSLAAVPEELAAEDALLELGEASVEEAAEVEGVESAANAANKAHHIFDVAKHKLDSVVEASGGKAEAFQALQKATSEATQGLSGQFKTVVQVAGHNVTVEGAVVNGTARIGTAYIP